MSINNRRITILVTGGAGFIGSAFVRQAIATGQTRVVVLDKLTYAGNLDSLQTITDDPNYSFIRGDINDSELIVELLASFKPDVIVNFAAESHVDRSIDAPREFLETNVVGTFTLLSAALQYFDQLDAYARSRFRFLHVSTDEVYGSLGTTGRFTEETRYAPNSPYSASKAAADHFVRAFYATYGLPVLTTNCSNNYGPFQFPEKLIPLMILNALEGKPLPVYGDGGNVRDWLYVEDHCRAIWAVIKGGQPGETYNIGGNCERTNLEVVRSICAIVDELCPGLPHSPCESLIKFVQDRPGHDRRYAIDCTKIIRELGYAPAVTFEEGLRSTVRWYIDSMRWVMRVSSGEYRRERLGIVRVAAANV
jgi:dTDP-glucose 4,6-dehydratase